MNKLPPLNWLRAFEASARHLSFSMAANELFVTQSAISQHIKLLENYLNQKLFIRTPKKLQLTDAGKCYLPVVSQSFHMLETATDEVFGSPENIIYCYCDIAFATHFIVPRLHDFYRKYPGVEVRLQNSVWWQRRQGFDNKSHIEIRYGSGQWHECSLRLNEDSIMPVVAANNTIGKRITLKMLANSPLYQLIGVQYSWQSWFNSVGFTQGKLKTIFQTDSSVNNIELARQGNGATLLSKLIGSHLIESGEFIQVHKHCFVPKESYYLMGELDDLNNNEKKFRQWLVYHCAQI